MNAWLFWCFFLVYLILHAALSACLNNHSNPQKKKQDPAQRDFQQMPEARKCGECLKTKVTCMRLWLKKQTNIWVRERGGEERERGGGGERERERERERVGVVLCNKSENIFKDETHYPCSRNTRVIKMNASKKGGKMNRLLKANGEYNKMHKSATVSNDMSLFLSTLYTCCKTGWIF